MEIIRYSDAGDSLEGLLTRPQGIAPRASVLVCHEGRGLGEHIHRRLGMLAGMGYIAFAADIFGNGSPVLSGADLIMARLEPWMKGGNRLRRRALAGLAALNALYDTPKTFAIGFCFGGTVALELARAGAPLDGVVSFHGGLSTSLPARANVIRSRILSCIGSSDGTISADDRSRFEAEMTASGASYQSLLFAGAKHGFTYEKTAAIPGFGYDAWADQQSWSAMKSFLDAIEAN